MGNKNNFLTGAGALAVLLAPLTPALAVQPADDDGAQRSENADIITVTAQRREQSARDVPIALSVFGAETLNRVGVNDVSDLAALTPGFSGFTVSNAQPLLTVRGVGSNDFSVGNDPALGVYVDDVYIGRSAGAVTSLFDVERVEILKGPQGTLFGRNTTAGALSIVRNRPGDEAEAYVSAAYGELETSEFQAAVNLPLGENGWAMRAAGIYRAAGEYLTNLVTGDDLGAAETFAGRVALRRQGAFSDIQLDVDYQNDDSDSAVYRSLTFPAPSGAPLRDDEVLTDLADNRADRDVVAVTLRGAFDIGNFALKSVSAFRSYEIDYREDTDGSPLTLVHFGTAEESKAYSQEFRFNSPADDRLVWFVGASLFYEDIDARTSVDYAEEDLCFLLAGAPCAPVLGVPGFAGSDVREINQASAEYLNLAVFGDMTWSATDRLNLTVGLRYSYDDKSATIFNPLPDGAVVAPAALGTPALFLAPTGGEIELTDDFSEFQPRFAVDYRAADNLLVYASATRGYKSGGFNILVPQAGAFDPETIWSYEAGLKGAVLNNALTFDLAGFYYEYDNLQVQVVQAVTVTANAASSTGRGVEASITARPVDGLSVIAGLALLDAEYDAFVFSPTQDFSGNALPRAPDVTANVSLAYTLPVTPDSNLDLRLDWSYASEQFLLAANQPESRQGAFHLLNGEITYDFAQGRYALSVFGRNLTDEVYINQAQVIDDLGVAVNQVARPRTVGARLQFRY